VFSEKSGRPNVVPQPQSDREPYPFGQAIKLKNYPLSSFGVTMEGRRMTPENNPRYRREKLLKNVEKILVEGSIQKTAATEEATGYGLPPNRMNDPNCKKASERNSGQQQRPQGPQGTHRATQRD